MLENKFDNYIFDVRSNNTFLWLKGIRGLAQIMVKTNKTLYPLVHLLMGLALNLPFTITSAERVLYIRKLVKNQLRNRMRD